MLTDSAPEFDRRFWIGHAYLPAAFFLAAIVPLECTDLDLRATDPFYDFARGEWPFVQAWWAKGLLHDQGKWIVIAFAIANALVLAGSFKVATWARWRRTTLYLLLCLGAAPLIVGTLKATTGRHCPWEMTRYGGRVEWTLLFDGPGALPPGVPVGACWPAAHASSALALFAVYFVGRASRRQRLWLWLAPGVLLGAAFAFAQHARGAHFLSHSVWSAAICWAVVLVIYRLMRGRVGPGV